MKIDNIDREKFVRNAIHWAKNNAKKYIEENFSGKSYINLKEDFLEIFIEDDELDDYWDESLGDLETMYLLERILIDCRYIEEDELTGEEIGWFSEDYICSGTIGIYPISQLDENILKTL